MNLIDETYFISVFSIAQLSEKSVRDKLKDMISTYQPLLLESAMGYELATAFIEGLDVGSDETADQRWIDLLNGKVFTTSYGVAAKWVGFKNSNKYLFSPLVCFVFYQWLRELNTQVAGINTVQSQPEKAVVASPGAKMTQAYNQMVDDIRILWEFLEVNKDTYPEFNLEDVAGMRISCLYPYYVTFGGRVSFNKFNRFSI